MQLGSQSEGLESQLEATKLEKTEPDGPKSQIMGHELDTKAYDEISETHSKSKEPMLARFVRRNHAPD